MKLKTTLQKTYFKFISSILLIKSLTDKAFGNTIYFEIRTSLLVIAGSFLFTFSSYAQSDNCKAKIIVEDNGNVDSASATGVLYSMIITNIGTSTDKYILSSANVNSDSKNPDDSPTNTNVILNTSFLDTQKNQITELNVNPGESIYFFSKLTVPTNTPVAKWSNTQITATSTNCTSYKVNTILHTYVLNPNND